MRLDHSLDLQRRGLCDTEKNLALVPESGETSLGSLGLGFERLGDLTDLGLHGSVDNDDSSSSLGDLRTGEYQTDSVSVVRQF